MVKDPLMANLHGSRFFKATILRAMNLWQSHSRRRRQKKAPCTGCGRTLINQRLRSPLQILIGGWTCLGCGHVHSERRPRQAPCSAVLQPAACDFSEEIRWPADRKSVGSGKSVLVSVKLGGSR